MILIVNGINTTKGGSGLHLLNVWTRSLDVRGRKYHLFDTVPAWPRLRISGLRSFFLALYFLPGTVMRAFGLPVFEMAYKISPFMILRFLLAVRRHNPKHVLFSHHAIFYLSFFCRRECAHYIVHDLLYRRARSLGFGRNASRFVFWMECRFYRRAASLVCLSCQEARILRRFGFRSVRLVSSYAMEGEVYPPRNYDFRRVAIVTDWRRPENVHGARKFFKRPSCNHKAMGGERIQFNMYGFDSSKNREALVALPGIAGSASVIATGVYKNHSDISEGIFIVPIYQGAGIKIKVLEAFRHRRYVLGTPGAFEGIPRSWLTGVAVIVNSIDDLPSANFEVDPEAFDRFESRYINQYSELGGIDFDAPVPGIVGVN